MAKINFPDVAKRLRSAAEAELKKELERYGLEDAGMRKMFKGDHEDTICVADLIEKGKTDKANDVIDNMETAAREMVGELIARTSPAYYMAFLIPDGWRPQ